MVFGLGVSTNPCSSIRALVCNIKSLVLPLLLWVDDPESHMVWSTILYTRCSAHHHLVRQIWRIRLGPLYYDVSSNLILAMSFPILPNRPLVT